jgi:hypothetical protein
MKTKFSELTRFPIVFAAAALLVGVTPGFGQTFGQSQREMNRVVLAAQTPKYDQLIHRLQSCNGPIRALVQWSKVLKPALRDLGYGERQIKSIRKALAHDSVTFDDARQFSRMWLARHGEEIAPMEIYRFLCHEQNACAAIEVASN